MAEVDAVHRRGILTNFKRYDQDVLRTFEQSVQRMPLKRFLKVLRQHVH